jgi:hypothetical protein
MLQFLRQPYIFAFVLACLTAVLVYMYSKTIEKDATRADKIFFKTLAAGVLAGAALTYATSPRSANVAIAEPFDPTTTALGI